MVSNVAVDCLADGEMEEEKTTTTKHVPSGKSGVLLLATAVPVIAAELRVSQGGNLLLEYLNLFFKKKKKYKNGYS